MSENNDTLWCLSASLLYILETAVPLTASADAALASFLLQELKRDEE